MDEKSGLSGPNLTNRGRRRKLEHNGLPQKDDADGTLNSMGKLYNKILNFSVVTRYFVYVLPLALAIAVPIILGATAARKATLAGVQITWFFTWIEIVWLGVWVAKIFAKSLPWIFQFLCGIVSSGTRKYALILKALEIPISLVGWTAINVATFTPVMTQNPYARGIGDTATKEWQATFRNFLLACFFCSLIFMVEKLLVQLISISYHRKQFDHKIKESKRNIHLLSLLYDASRALFPAYCLEFAAEDHIINDSIDGSARAGLGEGQPGSATPMRLLQNAGANLGRIGDKVTAAFGNVAQEITGKQVFNPTSAHSVVVEALEKRSSSEALARRVWMSFVMEGREALFRDDFADVLGIERIAEADECFACLDRDGNGDISLDEMVLTVSEFGRERHAIASSMHDVDQAIHVLDNLLVTIAFIISVFVFVAFFNKNFSTTLATAGTALLSLSFVFAVTCQEVLGSCIFLFVKHPYDVGDRVDIDDVQLVVERISLLFSVFKRVKDHKATQVANIVLNTKWIENITRSKAMREDILLYVSFDTSFEDIQLLKEEMLAFVRDRENNRDFQSDVDVEVTGIHEMNKLELKVEIRHKSNWANEAVRAARRSKFMCALVSALRKVPIYAPGGGDAVLGDVSKPAYSVAISAEEAERNRKDFVDDKDRSRMVPLNPENRPISPSSTHVDETGSTGASSAVDYKTTRTANLPGNTITSTHNRATQADFAQSHRSNPCSPEVGTSAGGTNDQLPADPSTPAPQVASNRDHRIEQVRDLLRRESNRGRRKVPAHSAGAFHPSDRIDEAVCSPPGNVRPPRISTATRFHEDATPNSVSQVNEASKSASKSDDFSNHTYAEHVQQRPIAGSSAIKRPVEGSTNNPWRAAGHANGRR